MSKNNKWIKNAIKPTDKGLLREKLGVKEGQKISQAKLIKAEHSSDPTLRKEAVLAATLKKLGRKKR